MNTFKIFFISLVIGISAVTAKAQSDYNPYKEFGKNAKVLTLSKGKYVEFFDTDTIEIIGSAVLNTKTMRVIGFIETDTLYSEGRLEPDVVSRWLSPDPLAVKYPDLSPYNFVANNPIIAVDPNGKEIFIVIANKETGEEHIYSLNATDVKAEHAKEYELMKTVVLYLQQSKNENSSMIYNQLDKKIAEGGEAIYVRFSDNLSSVDPQDYTTANINPLETHGWDIDHPAFGKNKGYQSPAVNFGAHELGHVWEKVVLANQDKEEFKPHVELLNSIYAEWDALDPSMKKEAFNDSRDEYVGRKVQNYFAEGLDEFISPSYNPTAGGNSLNPDIHIQHEEGDKKDFATKGENQANEFSER